MERTKHGEEDQRHTSDEMIGEPTSLRSAVAPTTTQLTRDQSKKRSQDASQDDQDDTAEASK